MIVFGERPGAAYPAPWTRMPQDWIDLAAWRAFCRAPYVQGQTKVRSNLDTPLVGRFPGLRIGTWGLDTLSLSYGRDVEQLLRFDPAELVPGEDAVALGRGRYVEQYQAWLRAGHVAPPVRVVQTEAGTLRVVDGNRRWLAHQREQKPLRAWVSWSVPSGLVDSSGRPIVTGLTWEISVQDALQAGERVQPRVRAAYEQVLQKKPELRRRAEALR